MEAVGYMPPPRSRDPPEQHVQQSGYLSGSRSTEEFHGDSCAQQDSYVCMKQLSALYVHCFSFVLGAFFCHPRAVYDSRSRLWEFLFLKRNSALPNFALAQYFGSDYKMYTDRQP